MKQEFKVIGDEVWLIFSDDEGKELSRFRCSEGRTILEPGFTIPHQGTKI
jgi:hypothetical protein